MNPAIKRQIQRRERLIGLVALTALMIAMLVVLFHLYKLLDRPHVYNLPLLQIKGTYLAGAAISMTLACFALAAVWFSFGSDSLLRRFVFVVCFFAVGWGVWFLGCIDSKDEVVPIRVSEIEPAIASSLLPVFFMAMVFPLMTARALFGHSLVSVWDPVARYARTGIKDVLIWTCVAAIVMGGICLAATVFTDLNDLIGGLLMPLGVVVGFCTLVVLPSVFGLFSKKIGFGLSSMVTLGLVLALAILIGKTLPMGNGRTLSLELFVQVVVSSGMGVLVFLWGVLAIRFFGYRLIPLGR